MKKIFAIVAITALITACTTVTQDKKDMLKLGMTKEEIISLLGKPIENEKYCEENILFYYDGYKWLDGNITSDECFPLVFEDNKLIGWGQDFYRAYKRKKW